MCESLMGQMQISCCARPGNDVGGMEPDSPKIALDWNDSGISKQRSSQASTENTRIPSQEAPLYETENDGDEQRTAEDKDKAAAALQAVVRGRAVRRKKEETPELVPALKVVEDIDKGKDAEGHIAMGDTAAQHTQEAAAAVEVKRTAPKSRKFISTERYCSEDSLGKEEPPFRSTTCPAQIDGTLTMEQLENNRDQPKKAEKKESKLLRKGSKTSLGSKEQLQRKGSSDKLGRQVSKDSKGSQEQSGKKNVNKDQEAVLPRPRRTRRASIGDVSELDEDFGAGRFGGTVVEAVLPSPRRMLRASASDIDSGAGRVGETVVEAVEEVKNEEEDEESQVELEMVRVKSKNLSDQENEESMQAKKRNEASGKQRHARADELVRMYQKKHNGAKTSSSDLYSRHSGRPRRLSWR